MCYRLSLRAPTRTSALWSPHLKCLDMSAVASLHAPLSLGQNLRSLTGPRCSLGSVLDAFIPHPEVSGLLCSLPSAPPAQPAVPLLANSFRAFRSLWNQPLPPTGDKSRLPCYSHLSPPVLSFTGMSVWLLFNYAYLTPRSQGLGLLGPLLNILCLAHSRHPHRRIVVLIQSSLLNTHT